MINPLNSPWNKPKNVYIQNTTLYRKWISIKTHMTTNPQIREAHGMLAVTVSNDILFLAQNTQKFRLKSHLDWAYYTPATLADAIDNDTVDAYYEIMLKDINSDPNVWKDTDFELELKTFYAVRNRRASLI